MILSMKLFLNWAGFLILASIYTFNVFIAKKRPFFLSPDLFKVFLPRHTAQVKLGRFPKNQFETLISSFWFCLRGYFQSKHSSDTSYV